MTDLRFQFLIFFIAFPVGLFLRASQCPKSMKRERAGLESKAQRNHSAVSDCMPSPERCASWPVLRPLSYFWCSSSLSLQWHTAHLVKNVNRKLFSGWMARVAQKNGHFCWDPTLKTLTQQWKLKASQKLALPQMSWCWGTSGSSHTWAQGIFHQWARTQWTPSKKLLWPRKQLFCRAKRLLNTPRNCGTGTTWKTPRSGLEKCDLALMTQPGFQCSSSAPAPHHLASHEPRAPIVVSLCADKFSGCSVLQPPESKPNFTPLAILAHVLGAIQPYAHLIHVQRLIPHQVCCRVCLVFCCCRCSLIGLVLSSCSVQPPRQLCSPPSKPALAFWQARRSGSRRLQVKSRMMTDLFLFIQSRSGTMGVAILCPPVIPA